jgi:hypothetical protein
MKQKNREASYTRHARATYCEACHATGPRFECGAMGLVVMRRALPDFCRHAHGEGMI